jgi:hypothetical protein
MWANSVWGLIGLSVAFGLAILALTPEEAWLRAWFSGTSIASAFGSIVVLCWPLHRQDNRVKLRDALNHPFRSIANSMEPTHLIVLGLAIALVGAVWLWRRAPPDVAATTQLGQIEQTAPASPPRPQQKEFANRTVHQLLAFRDGRSGLEADRLLEPFKGLWIPPSEGTIRVLTPDGSGGGAMAVVAVTDDDLIECHFSPGWVRELSRYKEGDQLRVTGKIGHYTGAHLLVLVESEIAK